MAFCTNCGATVSGAFCQQCGTAISGAASSPAAPPVVAQSAYPAPAVTPAPIPAGAPRKVSPLVWVLIVLVGLFVLGGIAVVGAGWFVASKVKEAGFDKNPALAVSKLIVAANPNLEVMDVNEEKGIITVKEKSTGKVVTLNFEDVKRGKIVLEDNSEGKTSRVEFGADSGKLPSWVPAYPGAKVEGNFSARNGEEEGGAFGFSSKDAASKVVDFYRDALQGAGFKISSTATTAETTMLTAQDENTKRSVMVTVAGSADGTTVSVIFGRK